MSTSYSDPIAPTVSIPGVLDASTTLTQAAPPAAPTEVTPPPPPAPAEAPAPPRKKPRMLADIVADIQARQELEARAAATGASAEDLRPNKPDVVSFTHDTMTAMPEVPDLHTSDHVVFRLHVSVPSSDVRIASLRLLMQRFKSVIEGDLLTPPEKVESAFPDSPLAKGVKAAQLTEAQASRRTRTGRPTLPRRGIITDEDGGNESQFTSMSDLAAQLGAAYASINQKYLQSCREQGKDPNMNDGVFFTYKGSRITLTAGVFNPEDHVDLG